jgi:ATP-dependent Clp protease ATP-binding subunit ClpB
MFHPLTKSQIVDVVRLQFDQLKQMLAKNGFAVQITNAALEYLAAAGFDPQYGARPVKRVLQRQLLNALSKRILAGDILKDQTVFVDAAADGIVFRQQQMESQSEEY